MVVTGFFCFMSSVLRHNNTSYAWWFTWFHLLNKRQRMPIEIPSVGPILYRSTTRLSVHHNIFFNNWAKKHTQTCFVIELYWTIKDRNLSLLNNKIMTSIKRSLTLIDLFDYKGHCLTVFYFFDLTLRHQLK